MLFLYEYRWYVAIAFAAYFDMAFRFLLMAWEAEKVPTLAPIDAKGGIAAETVGHAGMVVSANLSAITETFLKIKSGNATLHPASTIGRELQEIVDVVRASIHINPMAYPSEEIKHVIKEDFILKVGLYIIPVGAMVRFFFLFIRWIPIPFRKRYENALLHVSLLSVGSETQLVVHGREVHGPVSTNEGEDREGASTANPHVLMEIATVKTLTDISALLRDAAFMILQLHGKTTARWNWLSMKWLVAGLNALDEFRRTGKKDTIEEAQDCFQRSAEADPDNSEAMYVYASMLMARRNQADINKAIGIFNRALTTEKPKLRALIHSGLAFCYAQKIHRLAESKTGASEKAEQHSQQARIEWTKDPNAGQLHPLILTRLATARIVDEGDDSEQSREEVTARYLKAAPDVVGAIAIESDNWTYYNLLGWLLLKLAERDVDDLRGLTLNEGYSTNHPAPASEKYFHRSLELNPENKLTHANLCLLYATNWFRRSKIQSEFLHLCRYYGQKAIKLDPSYINGCRDLAVSLMRYCELDEAYNYYLKALKLADPAEKDREIMRSAKKVLDEIHNRKLDPIPITARERKRWCNPPKELLKPV